MSEQNHLHANQTSVPPTSVRNHHLEFEIFTHKYAGFWVRFWAYLIDLIIISSISGILIKPIFRIAGIKISNPSFLLFSPYKIVLLIVLLLYFVLMTKYFKQTIGKMIIGIKVISKDGSNLSWSTVLFRELFGRFISKLLTIPYFLVIFMPRKEALHDLFADTYVVHEDVYEKQLQSNRRNEYSGQELQEDPII